MDLTKRFYIDGRWVEPQSTEVCDVINPATEAVIATVALGGPDDIDDAVSAAKRAFTSFSLTTPAERIALLRRLADAYDARAEDMAQAMSREMGAPLSLARTAQIASGATHFRKMIEVLETFAFQDQRGRTLIMRDPIGVCGLITPWNWPLNQIVCKIAPALAAGCTMVLKPSEIAPLNALIFAQVIHDAGVPPGVFNLVNGAAATGQHLSCHPDVDMMSFTGSTRAGVAVAKAAADTIKRVHQELGGKSANIILPDADLQSAVQRGVDACFRNSGQSCNTPSRMLVPAPLLPEAIAIAQSATKACHVGPPEEENTVIGPLANQRQYEAVQKFIAAGITEGATLVAGGPGRPAHLKTGYYARPTVFAHVTPDMTIAREEIFGPVLSLIAYDTEDDAIRIANDTLYGLAAYVQGTNMDAVNRVAAKMRAGTIYLNYPVWDPGAPFGGYKQSGNGREYADFGLHEYLEIKGIVSPTG